MMNRVFASVIIAALASSIVASALGAERLTLEQCVESALKNHPSIKAAESSVSASSGRVAQAVSPYYPHLQADTGYSESRSASPFGENVTKGYTTTLSLSQLLYDFGRSGNALDFADAGFRASKYDHARVVQEVVLNVKQAYFGLLQSEKLLIVAEKTVEQAQSHLKQAEAFFRAGTKPRFDVTRAEVEVNNAKLGLITAKNNLRLSVISLNNAMGADPSALVSVEDTLAAEALIPTRAEAEQEALRGRPEFLKSNAELEAARGKLKAEQSNHFPSITASGSYSWANGTAEAGQFQSDLGNSWNAGVTLTMPLFEGGLTRGKVGEARANLLAARAQQEGLKQTILLEVNRTYADYESAQARVGVMDSSLKKAQENLALAQGRYEAGVGPYIDVTDAQVSAVKAETDFVQARYDYQLAAARLLKAMGR